MIRHWTGLLFWMAVCFAAAGLGSLMTTPSIPTWYAALRKPFWTPPNWVFGPVWTVLYFLMAVAAWRVWKVNGFVAARGALILFLIQLAINVAWSLFFFWLKSPAAALVDIGFLWAGILATLIAFYRHDVWASALMVPYLFWVAFAVALNAAIWRMNPVP